MNEKYKGEFCRVQTREQELRAKKERLATLSGNRWAR
jgi:hypothetical protein